MDASSPRARRPYRRPELRLFGDLRGLTRASLTQNMNDPANSSQTMT